MDATVTNQYCAVLARLVDQVKHRITCFATIWDYFLRRDLPSGIWTRPMTSHFCESGLEKMRSCWHQVIQIVILLKKIKLPISFRPRFQLGGDPKPDRSMKKLWKNKKAFFDKPSEKHLPFCKSHACFLFTRSLIFQPKNPVLRIAIVGHTEWHFWEFTS